METTLKLNKRKTKQQPRLKKGETLEQTLHQSGHTGGKEAQGKPRTPPVIRETQVKATWKQYFTSPGTACGDHTSSSRWPNAGQVRQPPPAAAWGPGGQCRPAHRALTLQGARIASCQRIGVHLCPTVVPGRGRGVLGS